MSGKETICTCSFFRGEAFRMLKTCVHFVESHLVYFFCSLPKGSGLDHWFESQALSEAVSSVNVDHLDPHNPSIHEILEASRLNKNKDILQLLGKIFLET